MRSRLLAFLPFLVKKVILEFKSPIEFWVLDEVVVVELRVLDEVVMTELRLPIE